MLPRWRSLVGVAGFARCVVSSAGGDEERPRPLMREFMGVNGHTVQFKPELYAPVVRMVRDYHPVRWDLGDDTSKSTEFPFARNRVDWRHVYGSWRKQGFTINACVMFDDMAPEKWKYPVADAAAYGE